MQKPKIYFLIFLSLLILVADYFGLLKPVRGFFEAKLIIPLRISLKPVMETQICPESQAEIAGLKTQIASLKEEIISTRKLLGAPLPSDWQFLPVKVVGEDKDEIVLAEGETGGIKKQMVAVYNGLFLGKVSFVSQNMARLELTSFPEKKEVVKILDNESLGLTGRGLLVGKGGGKMEVRQILAEEEIKENDLVMITYEGADLPVGKIKSISFQKGDAFKTAEVVSDLNPRILQTIFLITGKI